MAPRLCHTLIFGLTNDRERCDQVVYPRGQPDFLVVTKARPRLFGLVINRAYPKEILLSALLTHAKREAAFAASRQCL